MKNQLFLVAIAALLLTSCVSQKKYQDLESSKNKLQQEISRLNRVERDCNDLKKRMEDLQDEHADLMTERDNIAKRYANLEKANSDIVDRYDKLLDQNSTILTSSSAEKKVLSEELAIKENQLNTKEAKLAKLEREFAGKQAEMEALRQSLEEREARITSLNQQLDSQRGVLTDLKARLSNALLGFSAADLTVTQKDGKVYVSMSQNLLFAKGSNVIDSKGKEAIQKVSVVLAQNQDIDITVEGHTDSDGTAERNWDLSVTRATSVVNIMTASGIDPKRITASGRAFYVPIAPNDVEANKSKNRRTEIILSPRLNELFRLLNE